MTETFKFDSLPVNAEQLKALPEASLDTPFKAAALTVIALCRYPENKDEAIEMLNFLKGPQPLNTYELQFLRDRFMDKKDYVPRSYFKGATPANNYEPSKPYTIEVFDNPYSYTNEGYAMLLMTSGGADSPRQIKLRRKGEQWFLWEQFLLPDIRKPASQDPWA
ncbi:MAG: hypothetical protein J5760_06830 [Clostridia bacterium]|nr:hypothetical protein [Clostridia bacterium]